MDRERKPDRLLDLVDEATQARQPADGRDRRPAMRDPEIGQPSRRVEHVRDVEKRLTHSHVHAVVDRLDPPEVERLVEDLGGGEVASKAHRARRAERAGEWTTGLRRDADRAPAVAVAHEHGLDRVAVVRAEERLDRPVAGLALLDHLQGRERHRVRERRSQPLRQSRHLLVRRHATGCPLPDLTAAVRRLAALGERLLEEREVHGWER